MFLKNKVLKCLVLAILPLMLVYACEDETDDYTSGGWYQVGTNTGDPEDDPDTTIVVPAECVEPPIFAEKAEDFNMLFTRYSGWTGGDATYSIPLPDGRVLWLFGDSFIGTVNQNRSRPSGGFHRNAFVIQDGEEMITLQGAADAYIRPPEANWWYWPGHGYAHGDSLQVILFGFRSTGGGAWDFEYASVDVATFSLPDMELLSLERKIADPAVNFGAAIMEQNGYLYLYGSQKDGFNKFLHTARVNGQDLNGDWEFYTGSDWSAEEADSKPHFQHVSDEFAVFPYKGKFYLLTQHHLLGGEIYIYDSNRPEAGFNNQRRVYCTPQSQNPELFTYNAFAHTQFMENGELLVSYNVNTNNFSKLFSNADYYRPYFFRVKGWE